ncbi:MAG: DUF58 domain-containing protein [Deltaproteobacteria bacterium]|nr:DUF58 domain-containing protein [Deltaproteobacteria bacterium]
MKTLYRLLRAGMHTMLLFVLPWVTGALVGMVFDVQEVSETSGRFATLFAAVIVPLLVLQLAAIAVKIGRDIRIRKAEGRRGFGVFVEAVDRHVRVLTGRGMGMAFVSMVMVGLALSIKWGQLGVLAIAGLGIMYIASTGATIISAFAVRAFDDRVKRGRGAIDREMSPTVIDAGDAVEERFVLARVPVPPGFRLHIEEQLPARLGGDTRFALDRSVSRSEVTVSAPLPRTPRGVYRLGPAEIWFEDVLGLTRVFVAARATASLRSLPRLRPVVFQRRPRSMTKSEGNLSVLSRLATEEHFRTRPYVQGDDLRRVHWKQSINTGQLIVRVPESVPFSPSKVRLVLDTYLPPGWRIAADADGVKLKEGERAIARAPEVLDDVLDLLVEGWIGLAHTLLRRGEAVSLVAAVRDGDRTIVREIECKRGEERKWRAIGSDAAWQNDAPLEAVFTQVPSMPSQPGKPASSIIVSAGLWLGGGRPGPGTSFVVADGSTVVAEPEKDELGWIKKLLFFRYPVGSEDNKIDWRKLISPKPPSPEIVRRELARAAAQAVDHARASNAPVLLVRRRGLQLSLEAP